MKKQKTFVKAGIVLALVTAVSVAGYTFARYYQSIDIGGATGRIAKWSFSSANEESTTISLSDEKLAPGTNGSFEIDINAVGAEVPVDYSVLVSDEINIPQNMKFIAKIKDGEGKELSTTSEYSSFTELANNELTDNRIAYDGSNQERKIEVDWNWDFNELDTTSIDANDASDNQKLDCGFKIQIVGKQAQV